MHTTTARENAIMCSPTMTDKEKLARIFDINKEDIKKQFPQLYYAVLAVLDDEASPDASGYFTV